MTSQSKNNRLLPLTVIEAAAGGDVEAINAVLKHYAGYIARLSMRELYDEYGNPHLCVDEELRRRLGNETHYQAAHIPREITDVWTETCSPFPRFCPMLLDKYARKRTAGAS